MAATPIVPTGSGDLAHAVSRHLVGARFTDLDEDTVTTTKLSILDTVGVTLASSGLTPGVDDYVAVAAEFGGTQESTVLGFGDLRLPAPLAAWVNGALVHGLDFDDLVRDVGYHPSTPTVPTALALAERSVGISGRDLILAVALGNDLGTRLAAAVPSHAPWFGTPVFGCFAAAATAAKLLKLDAGGAHAALGIAYTQSAGTLEMRWSGNSNIASFNGSWPNKTGVMAALLAQRGAQGIENVFEGRGGLFPAYFGEHDRAEVTHDLGRRFRGAEVSFKVWPACGGSHCAIDATLQLFADTGLDPADVKSLTVATTLGTFALTQPIEARRAPTTPMDAKFSIPYAIAVAAVRGDVGLDDFRPERLNDPAVREFAQKISAVDDPSLAIRKAALPARIEVTTTDGRTFVQRCDQPRGVWPYSRLSQEEVIRKFRDCAAYARIPIDEAALDGFVDAVLNLEQVDDVAALTRELQS
ncbi:MmgE/PrpD family protein [Spirillospora sp. NPDC048819]|uniref:MmgE/PrpD family protein n=1 Tax=Spirillospora sp. NPDC048819 TaxID=3155268 RepID=UPI0033E5275B